MKYCCEGMREAVETCKAVRYTPQSRKYSIRFEPNGCFPIDFCPWCAKALPCDLQTKWFDVIYEEFGIPYFKLDVEEFAKEHPEFSTDEWWKKRGL